eukprot:CAMPEP_0117467730 /NCGR_PEP_ID=MMETSP0784-20121206/5806_1 /TAXON_ID=39447 /ORGANISM="" /LENGTH=885 /DNA_ID=CAMNT_0005261707 /DNA_START=23 /DNA_END=2680 /DNA_ORIENTATION=+
MGDDPDEDDKDKKSKKRPDVPLFRDMVLRKTIGKQQVKGPSPLVMLQEVFEETLDKGRFVGITMFWKYFEDINIDRIKHVTSVEYRNLRLMFWETIFYAGLLFFFTLYCFNCMSSAVYQARNDQLQYWGGCVGNHCRIHEVNDVNSFWQWMSNDFVNLAFTKFDYMPKVANLTTYFPDNDFSITMSPRFVGHDFSNVLLGTIRIRQARVLADTGCENSKLFSHAYPTCYGRYSADTRSKESYASRFAPFYLMGAFDWKDTDVTQQTGINGELGSYSGDGYFADFPPDERQTRTMIDDLWTWRWLDKATRAIVLELTMLNTNVNVITNTKILFEFGPTGSVVATIKTTASQVHFFTPSLKSGVALTVFLLQLVVFILFLVYTVWTGFLMFKSCRNFVGQNPIKYMRKQNCAGKFIFIVQTFVHHFGYIWNLCDLLLITLYFVHITLRFVTYIYVSAASNLASNVIGHPEYFMPFAGPMRDLQTSANVLAVTAVISWVKPFKYLCMMVWFRMLTRIMERCIAKLFTFAVLLLFVMFGFAVAFFCGFGATNQMFAGLQNTFLVLFFMLIDGYSIDEKWFHAGKLKIMPLVLIMYIVVMYFVLLNIFVAVLLDVYTISAEALQAKPGPNPMGVFIHTYYNWMKGISLVVEENEHHLRASDLSIRLGLLPGIVRRKWIEKKRKMQRIASECFAGLELFEGEDWLKENGQPALMDWSLPSSRLALEQMRSETNAGPVSVYDIPRQALEEEEVTHAQLQRLMDEDDTLKVLLNESRATNVIRKFRRANDPGEVRSLQANVFGRMDALETINTEEDVPDVPEINNCTKAMSGAVTDVRNKFRIQLTGIIEATATLFEHLVELTRGIDEIRGNHEDMMNILADHIDLDGDASDR